MRLFLQGATKDTISISNIRVVVDKRQPPARGAHINCPSAGSLDTLTLSTDLDATHPTLWAFSEVDHEKVGETPYFVSHSISLSQGEIFDLCVVAKTEKFRCDWHIEIDYRVGLEKRGSIRVPSKSGLSFRTSGHPEDGFLEEWDWAWYEESGPSFIEVSERNKELNSLSLDLDPTVEFGESDELSNTDEAGELADMEGYVPDQPPPKPSDD
ncbi:hypothetical protein [Nonomuraea sp. GTA35]|uniref:hypothetical protein n=1 Tax=Nonomuraea sp. GTA35 TaxID=1676746 RepID=UPI0035C2118D